MPTALTTPFDHWDARCAFIWYNDDEIFHYTAEDFDRQAKEFADRGINIVITFSCTHFRWSMWDYRDEINRTIEMVVEACHKYDIRVVEHHSAVLTFDPLNDDDIDYAGRVLVKRHSSLDTWPEMVKHWQSDRMINGVSMHSMQQIDGRTGELGRSVYRGWIMCPNNPDYRREYLAYLETIYALGVDGIMTDDLHFMAQGHACACEHCRRLFTERTGYEMPDFGEAWEKWYGNFDDPSFRAWRDFRFRSIEDYHKVVMDHYKGLGLNLLRPNYHSNSLSQSWSAYCMETLPDMHWVATECCFSNIIRYAWWFWAGEMAHKVAIGRARNIPAGAYFYPDRPDSMLFTWGLSKAFGGQWIPTPEGAAAPEKALAVEARLRKFEADHAAMFRKPERIATVGFFDSITNRERYEEANARSVYSIFLWHAACFRMNYQSDIFCEYELEDRIDTYKTVVLNEVALLSDSQLEQFAEFVKGGGNLIWVGQTGAKDYEGADRPIESLRSLLGLADFELPQDDAQPRDYTLGQGKIVTAGFDFAKDAHHVHPFFADRWTVPMQTRKFDLDNDVLARGFAEIVGLLNRINGQSDVTSENLPADVLISMFYQPECDSIALNVVNAAETMNHKASDEISHDDEIPFPVIQSEATVTMQKNQPQTRRTFQQVTITDPMRDTTLALEFTQNDDSLTLKIPAGTIHEFGLVKLK